MSDPSKDWYIPRGKDPILYRYSPDDLRKYGYADFLDGETPSSPSHEFFNPDIDTGLVAPIHPILRAINFPGTPLGHLSGHASRPATSLCSSLRTHVAAFSPRRLLSQTTYQDPRPADVDFQGTKHSY